MRITRFGSILHRPNELQISAAQVSPLACSQGYDPLYPSLGTFPLPNYQNNGPESSNCMISSMFLNSCPQSESFQQVSTLLTDATQESAAVYKLSQMPAKLM